jgi:hypothetical protein
LFDSFIFSSVCSVLSISLISSFSSLLSFFISTFFSTFLTVGSAITPFHSKYLLNDNLYNTAGYG